MAYNVNTISPAQANQFRQQRSDARSNLLSSRAQTNYQKSQARQQYSDNVYDFELQANRAREQLPTQHIQRGVFNSGIYRQALRDYSVDRLRGQRDLQRGYQRQLGDLTLGGRTQEDEYTRALSRLHSNQYAAQAEIAAALRGVY